MNKILFGLVVQGDIDTEVRYRYYTSAFVSTEANLTRVANLLVAFVRKKLWQEEEDEEDEEDYECRKVTDLRKKLIEQKGEEIFVDGQTPSKYLIDIFELEIEE